MKAPKDIRTVRRYTHRAFDGLRDDDRIVELDVDRKVIVRDGELIIVSDVPVDVTL